MPQPAAVEDVSINITLSRNLAPVSEVVLYYLVDFGKEQHVVASLVEDTMQEGSGEEVPSLVVHFHPGMRPRLQYDWYYPPLGLLDQYSYHVKGLLYVAGCA